MKAIQLFLCFVKFICFSLLSFAFIENLFSNFLYIAFLSEVFRSHVSFIPHFQQYLNARVTDIKFYLLQFVKKVTLDLFYVYRILSSIFKIKKLNFSPFKFNMWNNQLCGDNVYNFVFWVIIFVSLLQY